MAHKSTLVFAALLPCAVASELHPRAAYGCTPGVFAVPSHALSVCCMGGTIQPLTLSSCPGWPICTGPATVTPTSKPLSCATVITYTDGGDNSEYSSEVSSASESIAKSGVHIRTTLGVAGAAGSGDTSSSAAAASSSSSNGALGFSRTHNSAALYANIFGGDGMMMAQLGTGALAALALAVLL